MNTLETINFTLPIKEDANGLHLASDVANSFGRQYQAQYLSSQPFPHIVFDNFLPDEIVNKLLMNFPQEISSNDYIANSVHIENRKRGINPADCNYSARHMFSFLNSPPILKFIEGLSNIKHVSSDPYFLGGGYHEIKRGGKLSVHADFRSHQELNLQRRINLLIYLNKNWAPEYGGKLELWDSTMSNLCSSIEPIFNRCVIFSTDDKSYHGHPDPLECPENITRKSVALYYYTPFESNRNSSITRGTDFRFRSTDNFSTKFKISRRIIKTNIKEFFAKFRT